MNYQDYLSNCYNQGDIWNSLWRPLTEEEWIKYGSPDNGGIIIQPITQENYYSVTKQVVNHYIFLAKKQLVTNKDYQIIYEKDFIRTFEYNSYPMDFINTIFALVLRDSIHWNKLFTVGYIKDAGNGAGISFTNIPMKLDSLVSELMKLQKQTKVKDFIKHTEKMADIQLKIKEYEKRLAKT